MGRGPWGGQHMHTGSDTGMEHPIKALPSCSAPFPIRPHRGMQKWPVHSYSHMLLPFSLLAGQRPFCVRPRSLLGKAVVLFHLSGRGVSQVEPSVTLMSEQDGVACFPASTVTDILSPNEEMKPSPWCVGKALECKGWRGRFFSDPLCRYEISPGHRSTPP